MVAHPCYPNYSAGTDQEDRGLKLAYFPKDACKTPCQPIGINVRFYLKNTSSKKDWGCGASGRVLASQVQGPQFKPQLPPRHT
jgi:hypothetical protein